MKKVKKTDAVRYITQISEKMKETVLKEKISPDRRKQDIQCINELAESFEEAAECGEFAEKGERMRENGIWIPENIDRKSITEAYFRYAEGKLYQLAECAGPGLMSEREFREAYTAAGRLINEIESGETELI